MRHNMPVNTDAHGCPLPSVASLRGRRLRLRWRHMSPSDYIIALLALLTPGASISGEPSLSASGFGPVRFGMSVEQAASHLGTPLRKVDATYQDQRYVVVPTRGYAGMSFSVSAEGKVDGAYIAHNAPGVRTDRGLHVGSAANDVWRRYGRQAEVRAYQCGSAFLVYMYRVPGTPEHGVVYTVSDSGLVEGIMAGRLQYVSAPC